MRLNRFIIDQKLAAGEMSVTDSSVANQIGQVLRMKVGEKISLSDGRGYEAVATISEINRTVVKVEAETPRLSDTEPSMPVTLYCAILKRENFEWVAEKAVECGASEIVPVISVRTIKTGLREDRLKRIMKEAAEQSGRATMPKLGRTLEFSEALADAGRHGLSVFFQPGYETFKRRHVRESEARSVAIFIGPEGGWAEDEVEAAVREGALVYGLGKRVLRGETAAAVATFLAATAME